MPVNCAEKSILGMTQGKKKKSELAFTDIVKVKYWEKLLSEVPAHWNSTHQNQELPGTREAYSRIHRQAHNIADERLLTAVQLKLLIYLAYSLFLRSPRSCSLQMIQGNIHMLETSIANLN